MHINQILKKNKQNGRILTARIKQTSFQTSEKTRGASPPFWCSVVKACVNALTEEEREQVERLRWPSRGYLQELSEYQQRRRKLRKSRCTVM